MNMQITQPAQQRFNSHCNERKSHSWENPL